MADSDTEGPEGAFDPAALLQMDMEDAGSEISANLEMGEQEVDLQDESDAGNISDQQTPTKNDGRIKLKSFEDEKQFISLMELANMVQREEMDARSKFFSWQQANGRLMISKAYSHCTICDVHVPVIPNKPSNFVGHPILKTLVCIQCLKFYGDGNFDRGEDGIDLYCRWCAEGGTLFCCSSCPNVFCKKCVRLNFGANEVKKVNDATSWSCYVCESKLLWGYRALFATIAQILTDYKSAGEDVLSEEDRNKDLSACCTYRPDLKQYIKTQNKLMSNYCPGVLIPQIKTKVAPPVVKRVSQAPSYSVNRPQEGEEGGQVNDFFANGHFLEPALSTPPLTLKPPINLPSTPRHPPIAPQPRNTTHLVLIRQPIPRTPQPQLIRPRNLSMLQSAPYARSSPPALVRRTTPSILKSNLQPRFSGRGRLMSPQMRFRSPRAAPSPTFALRAPSNVPITSPTPSKVTSIANKPTSIEVPTPEWFSSVLDQALMSADFYKDEIIKLKLNNMSLLSKSDVNMRKDTHVLNTVRSLNWVMKSMLEQGLDIRRTITKSYPGMDSARESVNMDRLYALKGINKPSLSTPNKVIGGNRMKNSNSAVTPNRPVNGIKKSDDVVDLVSDDEDNSTTITNQVSLYKKHSLTISPVQPINNRNSLQIRQRIPLTPTPSNRLSIPVTQISQFNNNKLSPSPRKRKKKKVGSDDSEDDEDYIPKSDPSAMKRRRKSNLGNVQNKSSPQLMVTNIRSLQKDSNVTPKSSANLPYLNQVSEDVMEKVLQLDSGNDSSDLEEIDPETPKDPLDDDDKDDWIAQNPTAYEKYCVQYNLVKDWYIAMKTMSPSITNR